MHQGLQIRYNHQLLVVVHIVNHYYEKIDIHLLQQINYLVNFHICWNTFNRPNDKYEVSLSFG